MSTVLAAILRAAQPAFSSDADRLAFAVHAWMLSQGYKLVAVGEAADAIPAPDAPDTPSTGWNAGSDAGAYAFRYADASSSRPARPPPLVKAAVVGCALAVGLSSDASGARTVTLPVASYVKAGGGSDGVVEGYKDLDALVAALDAGLGGKEEEAEGGGPVGSSMPGGGGGGGIPAPGWGGGGGGGDAGPNRGDYSRPRPPGEDDLYPPGLGPGLPGLVHPHGGGPGIGPFHPAMPGGVGGHGGGGMHVGPGDPLFGGHPGFGGLGGPGGGGGHGGGGGGHLPPGLPPGARWDPVAPPGLPGFTPDDFVRPPPGPPGMRPPHPDIMPPGPGGGNPGFGGGMFG